MNPTHNDQTTFDDFQKIEIRCGTITEAREFPKARKPAYQLWIDFGEGVGVLKSSAQITTHYSTGELVGRQVLAVVNFPPRQIGPFRSQVLTLGLSDDEGEIVLIGPDRPVPNGSRMH